LHRALHRALQTVMDEMAPSLDVTMIKEVEDQATQLEAGGDYLEAQRYRERGLFLRKVCVCVYAMRSISLM
jgi:hypothetical protein